MAKDTLELRTIIDDPYAPYLFNFDYEFYDNDLKAIFENKFMEYYYFDEIGFPTIQRFKHNLKSKLHMIMPYYKKGSLHIVIFQRIQNRLRVAVFVAAVKGQIDNLFFCVRDIVSIVLLKLCNGRIAGRLRALRTEA